mgnify:CR=1 FL=1
MVISYIYWNSVAPADPSQSAGDRSSQLSDHAHFTTQAFGKNGFRCFGNPRQFSHSGGRADDAGQQEDDN